MNKKKEIKALKGQIVYSESSKKLKICENGYLVYEANQIKGVYRKRKIIRRIVLP